MPVPSHSCAEPKDEVIMKRLILVGMLNAMLVPTWLAAQRGGE